jgi:biotin operon repressor
MRADRLLSILLLLQTRGRMTARELAEHLEVSERTIYRDIEALGMAGIPISTERGPGGGCYLIDGYQTRLTGLTEAEVRALFLFGRNELGPYISAPLADLGLSKALEKEFRFHNLNNPDANKKKRLPSLLDSQHVDCHWPGKQDLPTRP